MDPIDLSELINSACERSPAHAATMAYLHHEVHRPRTTGPPFSQALSLQELEDDPRHEARVLARKFHKQGKFLAGATAASPYLHLSALASEPTPLRLPPSGVTASEAGQRAVIDRVNGTVPTDPAGRSRHDAAFSRGVTDRVRARTPFPEPLVLHVRPEDAPTTTIPVAGHDPILVYEHNADEVRAIWHGPHRTLRWRAITLDEILGDAITAIRAELED